MKKLFLYVFLGLLWCNVSFSKDLSGIKLLCKWGGVSQDEIVNQVGISFLSISMVNFFHSTKDGWKIEVWEDTYKIDIEKVRFKVYGYLERDTLKFMNAMRSRRLYSCSSVDIDFSFKDYFKNLLDEKTKKQELKNKI